MKIPHGWTLEPMKGTRDISILEAPGLGSTTIDFRLRGFRGGMFVLSGRFVGEKLTKRGHERKQYGGRGWKQAIVDDAVTWLKGTSRS